MIRNMGPLDRLARTVLGLILLAAPYLSGLAPLESRIATIFLVAAGLVMLLTAALGSCPLYRILGLKTCKACD
ncbi:DUF2892 domain-containing protein [Phaeobacter sp. B1627]|uniref:YgaP family membrane protein n=1 Tax=Phaeobacter sp. B1627 TaxID=2583809 RepID=UPI0011187B0E|nr:DUF2892 domain-containing protein [Phaeobacter sp. B1627]TNJ45133.1 DUF2892 domain-containing protein [Phaeobacter sp. B1627]